MKRRLCLFITCFAVLTACKNDQTKQTKEEAPSVNKSVTVPAFNRDSALTYVAKQLEFGPRVPNTEAHLACKAYFVQFLQNTGAKVTEQAFEGKVEDRTYQGYNIIAQFNVSNPRRILLGAHWDSRYISDADTDIEDRDDPVDGADDGASGVGVLMEVARQIQANPIDLGIDIVFFDVEDQGISGGGAAGMNTWGIGAQYYANNLPATPKPGFGILLDMVGSESAQFEKEGHSLRYARAQTDKIWSLAGKMGYSAYFIDRPSNPVTDDHYFINTIAEIPMLDIINRKPNGEFGDHWHTSDDTIEVISKRTLGVVGQVVLAVLYNESVGRF